LVQNRQRVGRRYSQWAGFERIPKGRLLDQLVDLDGPLGVAYERSVGFDKPDHTHDRHMLVCPRGAAIMDVIANGKRYRIDSRHVLWVPRGTLHADEAVTMLYDTLALYPSTGLLDAALDDSGLRGADRERLNQRYLLSKRTGFFDALLERYFYARVIQRSQTEAFQERQLLGEALRAAMGRPRAALRGPREARLDSVGIAEKSIRFIEANLFLPMPLAEIARHAGASTSTLLRSFRSATGRTPYAYIKARRLDEGKHLLEGGEHNVGEVAALVGYTELGAFSKAFRARFRKSPRDCLPR
jgi:AraC-like DNA-binding protein